MGPLTSPSPPSSQRFRRATSGAGRALCSGLTFLLLLQTTVAGAQDPSQPSGLKVVVLEGEGAINNSSQQRAKEPVVQVNDDNDVPVQDATVIFMLPESGASGTFGSSGLTLTMQTDERGQAIGKGLQPNKVIGQFQIRVIASQGGRTARAMITQTNAAPAVAKSSSKAMLVLIIIAGAAGGGAAAALAGKKGSSGAAAAPVGPATVVTPGTPVLGGPH
jgi:hypothetical protein